MRKITENFATFGNTPSLKQSTTYIEGYEYFEDYGTGQQSQTLSLIDEGRRFVMFESSVNPDYNLIRYQHPNHQGSCTLETDDTGNVITYEEYHPFGTTSYQATNSSITAAAKRYRYTGMERDEETGLSYHNARYYIPWLGRWLNPDPIGIGDGVNVYAYCKNNPIKHLDNFGTQTTNTEDKKNEHHEEQVKKSEEKKEKIIIQPSKSVLDAAKLPVTKLDAVMTGKGPVDGQNREKKEQETPIGTYHEGVYEITYSKNLRAVAPNNLENQAQVRYLGKPSYDQVMERAEQLSQAGGGSIEYKGIGLSTDGDVNVKIKSEDGKKTAGFKFNLANPEVKSIGYNKVSAGPSNLNLGVVSMTNKSTTVLDPPMKVDSSGVITGTVQYEFKIQTQALGGSALVAGAGIEKNTVRAIENFTSTAGKQSSRPVGSLTTKSLSGSLSFEGLKASLTVPLLFQKR